MGRISFNKATITFPSCLRRSWRNNYRGNTQVIKVRLIVFVGSGGLNVGIRTTYGTKDRDLVSPPSRWGVRVGQLSYLLDSLQSNLLRVLGFEIRFRDQVSDPKVKIMGLGEVLKLFRNRAANRRGVRLVGSQNSRLESYEPCLLDAGISNRLWPTWQDQSIRSGSSAKPRRVHLILDKNLKSKILKTDWLDAMRVLRNGKKIRKLLVRLIEYKSSKIWLP